MGCLDGLLRGAECAGRGDRCVSTASAGGEWRSGGAGEVAARVLPARQTENWPAATWPPFLAPRFFDEVRDATARAKDSTATSDCVRAPLIASLRSRPPTECCG